MKRNTISHTFIAMALMIVGSAIAFAHNGIEHVLGTVKALTATSITVETVKHEMTVIALDPTTAFTNKGDKASMKDLKVGVRVASIPKMMRAISLMRSRSNGAQHRLRERQRPGKHHQEWTPA